jgi:hypothetical protein
MKCPYCKNELETLTLVRLVIEKHTSFIRQEGDMKILRVFWTPNSLKSVGEYYQCPQCEKALTYSQDTAREILLDKEG